ncbi:MAG: NGG1p interacting factor NIF3 [Elusimicrobiota bacterium]|jgi:hypothetical protein|nr:NGG1p interacting factor NIF3 [Elusimicrobiota bacterium]
MKIKELFDTIIQIGMERDPRGRSAVENYLAEIKKNYDELSEKEKKYFDIEKFTNPYGDSRIYNDNDNEISKVLVGIDIETPELLLFDNIRSKGEKIDLAITHHPEGIALNNLPQVMNMQIDFLHKYGLPINLAENILLERIDDVSKGVLPTNYSRAVDAAKLLDIPFLGVHTPADNCVVHYLQALFDKENPKKMKDIFDLLLDIEEYQISYKESNAPKIVVGNKNSSCGKILVDMTGGTEGPVIAMEKLANAGIGTIVGMHFSQSHLKSAKANHLNIIIAGHIASDNLGMNLLFDELENRLKKLDYIECSGYKRISRRAGV